MTMRGRAIETNTITSKEATAQLAMLLCNCTDSRLASHSVDSLAAMYRVKHGKIALMLAAERERRARHG